MSKTIKIKKEGNYLLLKYKPTDGDIDWIKERIEKDRSFNLKNTFEFFKDDLFEVEDEFDLHLDGIIFILGVLEDNYYKVKDYILDTKYPVLIHENIKLDVKSFIIYRQKSVFKAIDNLLNEQIIIGGNKANSLPEIEFNNLLAKFPKKYEVDLYVKGRVSSVLKNYFDSTLNSEERYNKYLNKKEGFIGRDLTLDFWNNELNKFSSIYEKMKNMLESEIMYNEERWQKEILQILLLLYPKYIQVFSKVRIYDSYSNKNRELDYLLIDSNGNCDIVEIKKPFDNKVVSYSKYRDNHIPLRELSGSIMQVEKYIFYLNKCGKSGENMLNQRYKNELPSNFEIKITNPNAIIILGRDEGLNSRQLQDFEIIKRKYKNIIDILTYDDMLRRVDFKIQQLQKF